MYIGDDKYSQKIVCYKMLIYFNKIFEIEKKLQNENLDQFKVNILLDSNRALRTMAFKQNLKHLTIEILMNLSKKYPNNFNVYLCSGEPQKPYNMWSHYINNNKLLKSIGEICSVHHIKLCLFDNTVILTGANLSYDYFTNRYDRYILFQNQAQICNFLSSFVNIYIKYSQNLRLINSINQQHNFDKLSMKKELEYLLELFYYKNTLILDNFNYCEKNKSETDTLVSIYYSFPKLSMYSEKDVLKLVYLLPSIY